jgi:hypothetical protein
VRRSAGKYQYVDGDGDRLAALHSVVRAVPDRVLPHSVVNGVDTFTLTVGGNDTPSGTKYTCRVFNGCGSATSDPTTLIIQ